MLVSGSNQPSFETLTITRMLDQARAAVAAAPAGPVALIGFEPRCARGGPRRRHRHDGPDSTGSSCSRRHSTSAATGSGSAGQAASTPGGGPVRFEVFHHGDGVPRTVGFALYEDARAYDASELALTQPILIVQGRRDETVDPAMVARWAAARRTVDLRLVDDYHQLLASMSVIWAESARFFGLAGPAPARP